MKGLSKWKQWTARYNTACDWYSYCRWRRYRLVNWRALCADVALSLVTVAVRHAWLHVTGQSAARVGTGHLSRSCSPAITGRRCEARPVIQPSAELWTWIRSSAGSTEDVTWSARSWTRRPSPVELGWTSQGTWPTLSQQISSCRRIVLGLMLIFVDV